MAAWLPVGYSAISKFLDSISLELIDQLERDKLLTLVLGGCLRRRLVQLVLDDIARLRCFNWRKHFELHLHQSSHA